jgi:hypothetical protein
LLLEDRTREMDRCGLVSYLAAEWTRAWVEESDCPSPRDGTHRSGSRMALFEPFSDGGTGNSADSSSAITAPSTCVRNIRSEEVASVPDGNALRTLRSSSARSAWLLRFGIGIAQRRSVSANHPPIFPHVLAAPVPPPYLLPTQGSLRGGVVWSAPR